MSRAVSVVNDASVTVTGIVIVKGAGGNKVKKIPTHGHDLWALTTTKTGAATATVTLKGTNDPDPADNTGETLITNTHAGSDQKDGKVADAGYEYVFVDVTAITGQNFATGDIRVFGTGFAGTQ